MQENIPLTIERLSDEQEGEYRVVSTRQIRSILCDISESGAFAALYYDGVKDFIMTSLLDVGDKGFWVEQGVDMPKNRRIAESKRINLVSLMGQVKVQFAVGEIRAITYQGYPAFHLPLPAKLYRIQRREYYRLMLPLSEHLHCVIPIGKPQAENLKEVPIMDISVGGVKLFYAGNDIEFVLGKTYTGCQINLPEVGKISVAIIVKSVVSISPKLGQTIRRVGCEFMNIGNAYSIMLQRYVTNMQRIKASA